MRRLGTIACLVAMLGVAAPGASAATLTVYELALNVNGVTYSSAGSQTDVSGFPVPGLSNPAAFLGSGLGTLTFDFTPVVAATTSYSLIVYLDLEIDERLDTFFNEHGAVSGPAPAGVSWEIDEPGFVFGDIFDNVKARTLDSTNALPAGNSDDVALALGWSFTLDPGEWAQLTFGTALAEPTGFWLSQIDPDSPAGAAGTTVYFSGDLQIKTDQGIPEPTALWLVGLGVLLGARRLTRH